MDLSIIIVNWYSKNFLLECLKSIENQLSVIEFEVIVIDNASFDGAGEIILQQYPRVIYIQSDENLGFSRANNKAFRRSSGRFILFLNPDTVLERNTFQLLTDQMDKNREAGALGCRLLNSDGTIQYYCIQKFPNLLNQIFSSRLIDTRRLAKYHESVDPGPMPVDCVSGACLMVRREVFERVGGFSEDYFMYSEDVDLCRKITDAGFKILYFKGVSVVHHEGKSSVQKEKEVSSFSTLMMMDSRYRYFKIFNGIVYAKTYRFLMLFVGMLRCFLLYPLVWLSIGSRRQNIRTKIQKWRAVMAWCVGFRRACL